VERKMPVKIGTPKPEATPEDDVRHPPHRIDCDGDDRCDDKLISDEEIEAAAESLIEETQSELAIICR
jgi:hypothetical protein